LSGAGAPRSPQRRDEAEAIKATRGYHCALVGTKRVYKYKYYLCESSICASTRRSLARVDVPWHTFRRGNFGLFLLFEIAVKRRGMKNRTSASEVSATLGFPSSETVQGLRLWKAFVRLSPSQRSEVLAMVEQLATDPAPRPGGMSGRFSPR
jgi:hypothetical protein